MKLLAVIVNILLSSIFLKIYTSNFSDLISQISSNLISKGININDISSSNPLDFRELRLILLTISEVLYNRMYSVHLRQNVRDFINFLSHNSNELSVFLNNISTPTNNNISFFRKILFYTLRTDHNYSLFENFYFGIFNNKFQNIAVNIFLITSISGFYLKNEIKKKIETIELLYIKNIRRYDIVIVDNIYRILASLAINLFAFVFSLNSLGSFSNAFFQLFLSPIINYFLIILPFKKFNQFFKTILTILSLFLTNPFIITLLIKINFGFETKVNNIFLIIPHIILLTFSFLTIMRDLKEIEKEDM